MNQILKFIKRREINAQRGACPHRSLQNNTRRPRLYEMPAEAQLAKPQREVIPAHSHSLRGAKITERAGRFRTQAATIKGRRTFFGLASRLKLYRELLLLSPSQRRPISLSLSLSFSRARRSCYGRPAAPFSFSLSHSLLLNLQMQRRAVGCGSGGADLSGAHTRVLRHWLSEQKRGHARATGATRNLSMAAASLLSARRLRSLSSPCTSPSLRAARSLSLLSLGAQFKFAIKGAYESTWLSSYKYP